MTTFAALEVSKKLKTMAEKSKILKIRGCRLHKHYCNSENTL